MKELVKQICDIMDELKHELQSDTNDTVDKYKTIIEQAIYDYWMAGFGPAPEEGDNDN